MMKFKEYIKIESDDSINQVMSGDWISKSRSTWKAVDDEDNKMIILDVLKSVFQRLLDDVYYNEYY